MSGRIRRVATAATLALVASTVVVQASTARTEAMHLRGPFIGTYTGYLDAREATNLGDSRMAGRFRLVLRANGTYSTTNPLDPTAHGRLAALPGQRLRFFEDSGCTWGGFERSRGGIYRWSVKGRTLTLRLVSEGPCTGRTQSLAWVVWKRR